MRSVDESLEKRFELFEETGQASPEVVAFVREELEHVAEDWNLTVEEENAGMLASHLIMALERARSGETIESGNDEALAEELRERPWAIQKARSIAQSGEEKLGISLPEGEVSFVALHLVAIAEVQDMKSRDRKDDSR